MAASVARDRKALQLRIRGKKLREIAEQLGYAAPSNVVRAIQSQLQDTADPDLIEHYRALQLERLEELHDVWYPRAKGSRRRKPEVAALAALIRIYQHQERILGLTREPVLNVADAIRRAARAEGIDEEEAVREAEAAIHEYRHLWRVAG